MNQRYVGDGKVSLIAGGGRIYTDIAARFTRSEKTIEEIIASPYDANLVKTIVNSGHKAAVEFDYFLFGVEGYARVTEVQLVRKRIASFMIKSGRVDKRGKRSFDVVIPSNIEEFSSPVLVSASKVMLMNGQSLSSWNGAIKDVILEVDANLILNLTEGWYNDGVAKGVP